MKNFFLYFTVLLLMISCTPDKKTEHVQNSVFSFEKNITVPGTPEEVFDAATGDISPWWDHSFSENPMRFYIEPKPGGGFYEI